MANVTRTRVAIISDTHGAPLFPASDRRHAYREGFPKVDILIHCGDLTTEGHLEEYRDTLKMLGHFEAELKLVIAGNHDVSLDTDYFRRMGPTVHKDNFDENTTRKAKQLLKGREAMKAGVTYLEEGLHTFKLQSGATFTVYATPYQPEFCDWAFPYRGKEDRFNPPPHTTKYATSTVQTPVPDWPGVDIMMTHGPPLGHLDQTPNGAYLGCRHLQRAVARAMPRLHCFGHIHEGRGAERVTWSEIKPDYDTEASVTSALSVETDSGVSEMEVEQASYIDISSDAQRPLAFGEETLMVNAAIMDGNDTPANAPWIVDLDLPLDV